MSKNKTNQKTTTKAVAKARKKATTEVEESIDVSGIGSIEAVKEKEPIKDETTILLDSVENEIKSIYNEFIDNQRVYSRQLYNDMRNSLNRLAGLYLNDKSTITNPFVYAVLEKWQSIKISSCASYKEPDRLKKFMLIIQLISFYLK